MDNHSVVKAEVKAIGEVVTTQILTELSAPLTPILSWFDGSGNVLAGKNPKRTPRVSLQSNTRNLAASPLKSPPCKSCPARSGGLCKCALKRFSIATNSSPYYLQMRLIHILSLNLPCFLVSVLVPIETAFSIADVLSFWSRQ